MDRRQALSGLGVLIGGSVAGSGILPEMPDMISTEQKPAAAKSTKRKTTALSGNWKFQPDMKNIGEEEKWFSRDYAGVDWPTVLVPQAWDCYEASMWEYEGIGWYMTKISQQDFLSGKRISVIFNRVMYYSKVWLNGEFIGENIGGYLPFDFNIGSRLKAGTDNILVIRVDNKPRQEWLPAGKQIEWIQYGGILQRVELVSSSVTYIEDFTIRTTPVKMGAGIRCLVNVANETEAASEMELHIAVARGSMIATRTVTLQTKPNKTILLDVDITLEKADLWSPDNPALYNATASLRHKGVTIDDLTERFGIRKVSVEGSSILLNGKPLILKGVNRYDDYGRLGTTVPEKLLREELALMKSVGINTIRVHYPQSPDLLSLYDEYGFVMLEEVPINWWGVKWFGETTQSLDILQYAKPALTKMIKRDKNHPCLIIWSMANESETNNDIGITVMRELLRQAKHLDPTRLVTFVVAGNPAGHLAFDEADIVCINKYNGVFGDKTCNHISDIDRLGYKPFVEELTECRKNFTAKPIVITEFGIQGIKGIHGDVSYSEELQAAYIERIWEGIESVPGISGGVLWCWADYFHRKYLITYAAYGPYGVVTFDRKQKKSLQALKRMYGGSKMASSQKVTGK